MDGIFDSVPPKYIQTINSIIRDLIKGKIIPPVLICIIGKYYKPYILALYRRDFFGGVHPHKRLVNHIAI